MRVFSELSGSTAAALAPLAIAGFAFVAYCLYDLIRAPAVRYLPKWLWAIICVLSVPLGGIIYLIVGRGERDPQE